MLPTGGRCPRAVQNHHIIILAGHKGGARYMTREEAAVPSRRPSCSSQRITAIPSPLWSFFNQPRIPPAFLFVGAAGRTTAVAS